MPRRQHLRSSEKTFPRRQEGKSGCVQICNKGSRQSDHQRSSIKLRNLAFYVREDASLWAPWTHSFHMYLSYLGQFCFPSFPCFLHPHPPPAPQQSLWEVAASTWSQFWESSFSFAGQKLLMAVTFLFINMEVRYFHFTILM